MTDNQVFRLDSQLAGLDVRLHQMRSLTASIDQHPMMASAEAHGQLQDIVSRSSNRVKELRKLLTQITKSEHSLFLIGPAQLTGAREHHPQCLREIHDEFSKVQSALERLLDTPTPQQKMLERLLEQVDRQTEIAMIVVTEQIQELQRTPLALKCVCRQAQRWATPSFLIQILGQFFVEHTGFPRMDVKCGSPACINAQAPQLNVEYWSPLGRSWPHILRLHASYQANLGPALQLRTLRRVSDSAPAVSFATSGNVEGLQELFRRGAASPQDVSDTRGSSLIRWALYSRQYKMVRFLHAAGADADYRASNKAADAIMMGGFSTDVVDDLSRIANPDWVEEQNFPLLHRIALGFHGKDLEQALAENPVAVDCKDAMGRTALNWAAARGDGRSVAALLSYGADPNILDCQHSGPLSYAAEKNHTVCVRILLKAGAQPDPVIPSGRRVGSPLNCASRNASDPDLIRSLLDFGADVDASGVDGCTPLIHAARTDNVAFAQLFVEHNGNVNATSTAGQTPLTTAIANNSHRVLKLLLSRWAECGGCPSLPGSHLLKTIAQLADHETLAILCAAANHPWLKHNRKSHTGGFEKMLRERHDSDEKLCRAFACFVAVVGGQVPSSLTEEGLAINGQSSDSPYDVSGKERVVAKHLFD